MTSAEWVRSTAQQLGEAGISSARLEAEVLLAHGLGCERQTLLVNPGREVDPKAFVDLVDRRLSRVPLAYITGRREFFGRDFKVDPSVLIPRQETECLVEAALVLARNHVQPVQILDVGTGSGCIAVTLSLELPGAIVSAVDISVDALSVAKANATSLVAKVEFHQSDLWPPGQARFDIILSNPPYIREDAELPPEVAKNEPRLALFAGADGLSFYRRIADEAEAALAPDGSLLVELGDHMAPATLHVFESAGWRIDDIQDDLGGMPRVLIASRKPVLS